MMLSLNVLTVRCAVLKIYVEARRNNDSASRIFYEKASSHTFRNYYCYIDGFYNKDFTNQYN